MSFCISPLPDCRGPEARTHMGRSGFPHRRCTFTTRATHDRHRAVVWFKKKDNPRSTYEDASRDRTRFLVTPLLMSSLRRWPHQFAHRRLQHLPLESRSPTTASRPPKGSSEFLASRMQHARTVDAPPARGMTTEKAGHETNGRSMTTDERGMPRAANAPRAGKRLSVVIVRESGRSSKYRPFCKASLPLQSPRTGYWMPRLRGA